MAAPPPLPLLVRTQIATLLRVAAVTVSQLEREGLPIAIPGAPGKATRYDAAAVVAWHVAREVAKVSGDGKGALNPAAERARRDRAQAELTEQTHAARAGELLPRSVYEQELGPVLLAFRAKVLAAPRAWAPALARLAPKGPGAVEQALTARTRELLTELAALQIGAARRRRAPARKRQAAL